MIAKYLTLSADLCSAFGMRRVYHAIHAGSQFFAADELAIKDQHGSWWAWKRIPE